MLYVITTYFDTVLFLSGDGKLYHAYPEEAEANLFLTETGHIVTIPNGSTAFEKIEIRDNCGELHFISNDQFLCADIGGAIGWRAHCLEMERFKLLPQTVFNEIREMRQVNIPRKIRNFSINKIIHQTYDDRTAPAQFLDAISKIKSMNPDWDYAYYSSKDRMDFIYHFYGWDVLENYLRINPRYGAARADLFRYLCLYQMGGIYLDIKSSTNVPFDSFIRQDDQFLLSQWQNGPGERYEGYGLGPEVSAVEGGEYQQWHIISAKSHPFLEKVINNCLARIHRYHERYFSIGKLGVLRVTGPYVYTTSINPHLSQYPHRFFDSEAAGLIYSYVDNHTKLFKRHYSEETSTLIL